MTLDDVVKEWSKNKPFEMLPCFRCKTTTCVQTTENEIDLNQEECDALDCDIGDSQYGQCCKCFELEEKDMCAACLPAKKQKRQRTKK